MEVEYLGHKISGVGIITITSKVNSNSEITSSNKSDRNTNSFGNGRPLKEIYQRLCCLCRATARISSSLKSEETCKE